MLIIRIEHPTDSLGIFSNRLKGVHSCLDGRVSTFTFYSDDFNYYSRHLNMTPASSIYGFIRGFHYCAYPSLEVMDMWINKEEVRELINLGFVVLMLELDLSFGDAIITDEQVLFSRKSVISSRDVSSLF